MSTSKHQRKQKRNNRHIHQIDENIHENAIVQDITIPWLYEAHSILLLAIVIAVIMFSAFYYETDDANINLKNGIYLCIFLFLALGCLIFPAGPYVRPHPIVWRLLFGILVLYAFALLLLLCQTPMGARHFLRIMDPSLGVPLEEKSYATDCSFTWDNFLDKMDLFVPAHFFGWGLKAIFIRDRTLVWAWSLSWELIEYATCYFIPNFAECMWDSIFLDFLVCNGIGIEFGLYLCKKLWPHQKSLHHRKWLSVYEIPTICGKFKRFALQFTPFELDEMHWESTKNIKRYIYIHLLMIAVILVDLNGFLLKLFLWIPTEHSLFILREAVLAFSGVIGVHQYYLYISNEHCKKLGSINWLAIVILTLEVGVIYKCRVQPFPVMPNINRICLVIAFIIYLIFSSIVLRQFPQRKQKKK